MTAAEPVSRRCWCGRPVMLSGECREGHVWSGECDGKHVVSRCECPDPYCPVHARCLSGHRLIIAPDDPAFCPECGHDVMPVGACGRAAS